MVRVVLGLVLASFFTVKGETLEEILNRTYDSKLIKSKEYEIKSFEGEILKARVFANPEVYAEFGKLISRRDSSGTVTELSVSQPLYLYGSRKFKIEEALNLYDATKYSFETFKREFISDVYTLFFEALYNRELLEISKQELAFSEDILNFVKKTYELGEISKIDMLRSEKDYELTKINYEKQKLSYRQSIERLSVKVGFNVSTVEGDISQLKEIKDVDFLQLPDYRFIQSNLKALSNQEEYYRALAKPQISVGFIGREVFRNNYEGGVFLSATLPVFNRYLGELLTIRNKKAYFENLLDYNLKNYSIKFESIKRTDKLLKGQIQELQEKVIPTLNQQLQLANKSYRLKVITLFELTSIKNDYYQTLRFKYELLNNAHRNYGEYIKIGGSL